MKKLILLGMIIIIGALVARSVLGGHDHAH